MDIHSASQARANLFKLLEKVNKESKTKRRKVRKSLGESARPSSSNKTAKKYNMTPCESTKSMMTTSR